MTSKHVHSSGLRRSDLVTDTSGSYAQYGPITTVRRTGLRWTAMTESGTELSFGLFDLITVDRPKEN